MNANTLATLRRELHRQRRAMFQAVAGFEADLDAIANDHEAELEERAQEDSDARAYASLDDRGKRAIDEIDAALRRIAEGRYGECGACGQRIAVARLRALPAALHCIRCARTVKDMGAAA